LANIKEIKRLRGGDLVVAAQANVQIDAEIGKKDHFRTETGSAPGSGRGTGPSGSKSLADAGSSAYNPMSAVDG